MKTAPSRSVSIFPTGTPSIGANNVGIFAHNATRGLVVAASVNAPDAVLTYFASPSSLRETMPICLKRSSRFSARVFNSKAAPAGMSTNTWTLPAVRLAICNWERSALVSCEMKSSSCCLLVSGKRAQVDALDDQLCLARFRFFDRFKFCEMFFDRFDELVDSLLEPQHLHVDKLQSRQLVADLGGKFGRLQHHGEDRPPGVLREVDLLADVIGGGGVGESMRTKALQVSIAWTICTRQVFPALIAARSIQTLMPACDIFPTMVSTTSVSRLE